MSDRLTIRLPTGAEAPGLAMIDEVAGRHGMTASQWVRSLITRELKTLGDLPAHSANAELRAYAAARTDAAVFEAHSTFESKHRSARDAHLRPRAPKRPAIMRVRVSLSADEALALEAAGDAYAMPIQQAATIIVRRWIGKNRKPPAAVLALLGGLRAEIRRIGINVNQLTHAANKLVTDPRFRRQDDVVDHLGEVERFRRELDVVMKDIREAIGLDRALWENTEARPAERLELLPHPSVEIAYEDDDPP